MAGVAGVAGVAVADMAAAGTAVAAADTAVVSVVDTAVVSVVDTSAVDTLRPDMSRPDTSWSGMDPVYTSRLEIAPACTSRADTAAISGTAVGGITALARAGYGRMFTASTCGGAIKILQSRRAPAAPSPHTN